MKAAFDNSAASYDEHFTNTSIGRLQRNKIWSYLEKVYDHRFPANVLELNCGTGADALFFAQNGSRVLATDNSLRMLELTRSKAEEFQLMSFIETQRLDLTSFHTLRIKEPFDLIFSNFGGLNCIGINNIEHLLTTAAKFLSPKGRIILVLMPRFCAWETLFYTSRLNFSKAFRRRKRNVQKAMIEKGKVNIWYHDPKQIAALATRYYNIINIQPVGITIPPTYLQKTFVSNQRILNKLDALENKLNRYRFLASMADHYLIDLQLR